MSLKACLKHNAKDGRTKQMTQKFHMKKPKRKQNIALLILNPRIKKPLYGALNHLVM